MEYAFTSNTIKKRYGKYTALSGLTMNVPKGSIYGLIGRNGAGKTTAIRIICGLQEPSEGEYTLYGAGSGDRRISDARRRIGAVVETPALYRDLTAIENIRQQYRVIGVPDHSGAEELLKLVGLEDTGKKKVKHFSLGMRQRLGIALSLAGDPDFLLLDEPINGLDPQGIIEIRELICKLNREYGITVLISSHILGELAKLATCFGFIDSGRMVREISAEELSAECRKCVRLEVTDTAALARVLDADKTEYRIVSDTQAEIFDTVQVTKLALALHAEGCDILTMSEKNESLESYYVGLVGGEVHE